MAQRKFYNYINQQIESFDKCIKISSVVDRYSTKNKHEIALFINNKDNFANINHAISHLKSKSSSNEITSKIDKLVSTLNTQNSTFDIKEDDITEDVYRVLVFTLVYFVTGNKHDKQSTNGKYDIQTLTQDKLIGLEKGNNNQIFYRGHSDISWFIQPSFIRGLGESAIIDDTYISKRYKDTKLLEKFNKTLNISNSLSNNLYFKYSFIQHSVSYSVLTDLTSSPVIGTSFALSNISAINNFNGVDSSLIKIQIDNKSKILSDECEINDILKNESFIVLNDGKFTFGKDQVISNKTIRFNSFTEIYNHLKPNFYVFNIQTNDRMKYQQGSFIYFYGKDLVVFKDRIFYELCDDLRITKYKITRKDSKRKLIEYIKDKRNYYDQEHLLNPYRYFNE